MADKELEIVTIVVADAKRGLSSHGYNELKHLINIINNYKRNTGITSDNSTEAYVVYKDLKRLP